MARINSGYSINFTTNTIVITKEFQQQSSQMGTPEFTTMKALRQEFPSMTIVRKTAKKRKSGSVRITYAAMAVYINCLRDGDKWMKEFEVIRKMSLAQSSPYNYVYQWFCATFPSYAKCPNFDDDGYALLGKTA